ncbi:MAG: DUF4105 domain-containing protein [Bdellovibrionales bacterium]
MNLIYGAGHAFNLALLNDPQLKIEKLDVLISESSFNRIESAFGHSSLRIKMSKNNIAYDYVISFVANTEDDSEIELLAKGVSGFYPVVALISQTQLYLHTKLIVEKRSLNIYSLPLNAELKIGIINQLKQIILSKYNMGRYLFTHNNCGTVLIDFLRAAGFSLSTFAHKVNPIAPIQIEGLILAPALLTFFPKKVIDSPTKFLPAEFDSEDYENDWDDSQKETLKKLNSNQLRMIFYALNPINKKKRGFVTSELIARKENLTIDLYKLLENLTKPFRICSDEICARSEIQANLGELSLIELRRIYSRNFSERARTLQLIYGDRIIKSKQGQNFNFLLNELEKLIQIKKGVP